MFHHISPRSPLYHCRPHRSTDLTRYVDSTCPTDVHATLVSSTNFTRMGDAAFLSPCFVLSTSAWPFAIDILGMGQVEVEMADHIYIYIDTAGRQMQQIHNTQRVRLRAPRVVFVRTKKWQKICGTYFEQPHDGRIRELKLHQTRFPQKAQMLRKVHSSA
jgi:hypothetical protein